MNGNNAVMSINNGIICVINAIIRIDGGYLNSVAGRG